MRAISIFSLEAGTSTLGCRAVKALRILVNMSAMGSDVILASPFPLPARLDHAGNFSGESELAKTNPAETELAQVTPRTPAAMAAVPVPALELARTGLLCF